MQTIVCITSRDITESHYHIFKIWTNILRYSWPGTLPKCKHCQNHFPSEIPQGKGTREWRGIRLLLRPLCLCNFLLIAKLAGGGGRKILEHLQKISCCLIWRLWGNILDPNYTVIICYLFRYDCDIKNEWDVNAWQVFLTVYIDAGT